MKLVTLTILAGLALGASSAPATAHQQQHQAALVAYETPAAEIPGVHPTFPEKPVDASTWDDTADTSSDLDSYDVINTNPNVHLDTDLNNDATDPLLEDHNVEPVDMLPEHTTDRIPTRDVNNYDPFADPLP